MTQKLDCTIVIKMPQLKKRWITNLSALPLHSYICGPENLTLSVENNKIRGMKYRIRFRKEVQLWTLAKDRIVVWNVYVPCIGLTANQQASFVSYARVFFKEKDCLETRLKARRVPPMRPL